jgi:hypothetical protein
MESERIEEVISYMNERGFTVSAAEVLEFEQSGSLPPSVIGDEYDEARDDALADALDVDTTPIDYWTPPRHLPRV